jgi:hypothetical protein
MREIFASNSNFMNGSKNILEQIMLARRAKSKGSKQDDGNVQKRREEIIAIACKYLEKPEIRRGAESRTKNEIERICVKISRSVCENKHALAEKLVWYYCSSLLLHKRTYVKRASALRSINEFLTPIAGGIILKVLREISSYFPEEKKFAADAKEITLHMEDYLKSGKRFINLKDSKREFYLKELKRLEEKYKLMVRIPEESVILSLDQTGHNEAVSKLIYSYSVLLLSSNHHTSWHARRWLKEKATYAPNEVSETVSQVCSAFGEVHRLKEFSDKIANIAKEQNALTSIISEYKHKDRDLKDFIRILESRPKNRLKFNPKNQPAPRLRLL